MSAFTKNKPEGYHAAYEFIVAEIKKKFPDFNDYIFIVLLPGVMVRVRKYVIDGVETYSLEFGLGVFYFERTWKEQFYNAYKDHITEEEAEAIAKVVLKGHSIKEEEISLYLEWCHEMIMVCHKLFAHPFVAPNLDYDIFKQTTER